MPRKLDGSLRGKACAVAVYPAYSADVLGDLNYEEVEVLHLPPFNPRPGSMNKQVRQAERAFASALRGYPGFNFNDPWSGEYHAQLLGSVCDWKFSSVGFSREAQYSPAERRDIAADLLYGSDDAKRPPIDIDIMNRISCHDVEAEMELLASEQTQAELFNFLRNGLLAAGVDETVLAPAMELDPDKAVHTATGSAMKQARPRETPKTTTAPVFKESPVQLFHTLSKAGDDKKQAKPVSTPSLAESTAASKKLAAEAVQAMQAQAAAPSSEAGAAAVPVAPVAAVVPKNSQQVEYMIKDLYSAAEALSKLDLSGIDHAAADQKRMTELENRARNLEQKLQASQGEVEQRDEQIRALKRAATEASQAHGKNKRALEEQIAELEKRVRNSAEKAQVIELQAAVEDLERDIEPLRKANARLGEVVALLSSGQEVGQVVTEAEAAKQDVDSYANFYEAAATENEAFRDRIFELEAQLARYEALQYGKSDSEAETAEARPAKAKLPANIKTNAAMLEYAAQEFKYIQVGPDAVEHAKKLDQHGKAATWCKRAFTALAGMNDYAREVVENGLEMKLPDFLSSGLTHNGLAVGRVAQESPNKRNLASDYRKSRTFSAPPAWSRASEECYSHVRIDQPYPGPRLHFFDDLRGENEAFLVGYYGEHLPNRLAGSVS